MEWPQYQCHKRVRALKIASVSSTGNRVTFEDPAHGEVMLPRVWLDKHKPEPGGYLVAYDDDYLSYSPAAAFENGYTLVPGEGE